MEAGSELIDAVSALDAENIKKYETFASKKKKCEAISLWFENRSEGNENIKTD